MRRKQALTEPQAEYVSVNKRQEHKLLRREAKAEAAARIELEIEKELLERLKKGTYDSVINYNKEAFEQLLDQEEDVEDIERQEQLEDEEDDLADFYMSTDEDEEEDEDEEPVRKKSRLVIEREYEPTSKKSTKQAELEW